MTTYLRPGHSHTLKGTLTASSTLVAEGGIGTTPGAVLDVPAEFLNLGTIELDGGTGTGTGATLSDTGVLTNAGLIALNAGTQDGAGGYAQIGASGTLYNNVLLSLAAGETGNAAGATLVDAGLITNSRSITLLGGAALADPTGAATLSVTGKLESSEQISVLGSYYHSAGHTDAAGSGRLQVTGVFLNSGQLTLGNQVENDNGGVLYDAGAISNTGTITALAGGYSYNSGNAGSTIDVVGVLTNQGQIVLANGTYGRSIYFTRRGQGGTLIDNGSLTSSGTITVDGTGRGGGTGSLLVNATLVSTGQITVGEAAAASIAAAGTATSAGIFNVNGGAATTYYGYPTGGGGGTLNVTGAMTNSGLLVLGGGITGDRSGLAYGGFGAQMKVIGSFTNTGTISGDGGGGGVAYVPFLVGTGATIQVQGVLANQGSIGLGAGLKSSIHVYGKGAQLIDSGTVVNSGIISLAAGPGFAGGLVTVTATGGLTDSGVINGGGTLQNAGLIAASGTTGSIAVGTFDNDGTVCVAVHDSLNVASTVGAYYRDTGMFDVSAYATLTLGGAIAASQSVAFIGAGGSLGLGDAIAFAGTLDSLAIGDTIDFLDQTVTGVTTSGNKLTIDLKGGHAFSLALDSPLTGVSFELSHDHHGGTDVLVVPGG